MAASINAKRAGEAISNNVSMKFIQEQERHRNQDSAQRSDSEVKPLAATSSSNSKESKNRKLQCYNRGKMIILRKIVERET